MNLIKKLKNLITHRCVKKRIKEAVGLSGADGRKRLVLLVGGKPRVFTKKQLQALIQKRYFVKGTTIQDLEKIALFTTHNRCDNVS
ncbi:MAG: hypothetical protein PHO36_16160 [Parabacteroides sp.]|nr:hypothetical protein [Parabacteroides sp.]